MKKKAIIGVLLVITAMMTYAGMAQPLHYALAENSYVKIQTVQAIFQPTEIARVDGNVLVSSNNTNGDDIHPKIVYGSGKILITYEQHISAFEVTTPIVFSEDNGTTWTLAYEIGPGLSGSGLLQSPDLCYCPDIDYFFYDSVDPVNESYNLKISRFPANLSVTNIPVYQVSGSGATDHYSAAVTWVSDIIVTPYVCDEPDYSLWKCPGLGYWQGENFDHPPNIGGFYYDGQSVLHTAPADYMEAATGSERMYMVMQTDNGSTGTSMISFKATVTNLSLLLTPGGGPGGMDMYADIEIWPWQRHFKAANGVLDAREPDISASGTNVVIVYMSNDTTYGDWDIVCAYSNNSGDTWAYSTIGMPQVDDTNPAVFITGDTVYCAYVHSGNLYMVISQDGGATWGTPVQINEVNGTVVAEPRAMDISEGGIVWTDTRNGNRDIYYAPIPEAVPFSYDLYTGWNLITVPVENNYSASDLAALIPGCTMIAWWDAAAGTYKTFIVGVTPPGSPFDFAIADGVGYYVKVAGDTTLTVSGMPLSTVNVQLYPGWNTIGWWKDAPTTASSLAGNITTCTMLAKYDAASGSYITFLVGITPPGSPYDFTVERGMGLFAKVTSGSVWHGEG